MKGRAGIFLFLALGASLAAYLLLRPSGDRDRRRIAPPISGAASLDEPVDVSQALQKGDSFHPVDGAAPVLLRYGFQPGDVLRYAFLNSHRTVQRSAVDVSQFSRGPVNPADTLPKMGTMSMSLRMQGVMELRTYEAEDSEMLLGIRFREVSATMEGDAPMEPQKLEPLEKALAEGESTARITDRGEVKGFTFPTGLGAQGANIVRSFVFELMLRLPEKDETRWTAEERDETGSYVASYSTEGGALEDGSRRVRISKTRGTYQRINSLGKHAAMEAVRIDGAENNRRTSAVFDPDAGRVEWLASTGRTSIRNGKEYELDSDAEIRFTLTHAARGAQLGAAPKGRTSGSAPEANVHAQEERFKSRWERRREEEKITLDSLRSRRKALESAGEKASEERHRIFLDLKNLLRYDASQVSSARAILAAKDHEDREEREFLAGALGAAGTPEAQSALGELAADATVKPEARAAAVQASALMPEPPTGELEAKMKSLSQSEPEPGLRNLALTVVGAMAYQAAKHGDEERAVRLVKYLAGRRDEERDPSWKLLWLVAMGNTRRPEAYGPMEACLADPDSAVAAQAAALLGQLEDPRVEGRLKQVLESPAAPLEVALGAVRGLEDRATPEARRVLETVVRDRREEELLKRAQIALARVPEAAPTSGVPVDFVEK